MNEHPVQRQSVEGYGWGTTGGSMPLKHRVLRRESGCQVEKEASDRGKPSRLWI